MLAPKSLEPPRSLPTASRHDDAILAILTSPLRRGETVMIGFARKELALREAFATLSVQDARELHDRLSACRPGDMLAARFAGLVVERRVRLLAFLADARRREALAAAASAKRGAR